MSGTYAKGTTVPPERTRAEIERTLRRYGADSFVSGYSPAAAFIGFVAHGRNIRFTLVLNGETEPEERRLWRCLLLAIKAKLEVVESGIASFEEEFLANIVLPGGTTVGDHVGPEISKAYELGGVPQLMLGGGT